MRMDLEVTLTLKSKLEISDQENVSENKSLNYQIDRLSNDFRFYSKGNASGTHHSMWAGSLKTTICVGSEGAVFKIPPYHYLGQRVA